MILLDEEVTAASAVSGDNTAQTHVRSRFRNLGHQILSELRLPENLDGRFRWTGSGCVPDPH